MWPFSKKQVIFSNKKYIDYLPVGTIIKLYNDNTEYMIYRYLGNACMTFNCKSQSLKKSKIFYKIIDNKKTFYHVDYAITTYPAGDLSEVLYIIQDDIEKIIYLGYNDRYRENILNDIDLWNGKKGDINE